MTDEHDDIEDGSDYDVGYRRPPLGSRFSSTNQPANRGRKKGSRGIKTIMNEFATAPYPYTRNGVRVKGAPFEIMVRTLFAAGIQDAKLGFQFYNLARSVLGDEDLGGRSTPLARLDKALLAEFASNILADLEGDGEDLEGGEDGDGPVDQGGDDVA